MKRILNILFCVSVLMLLTSCWSCNRADTPSDDNSGIQQPSGGAGDDFAALPEARTELYRYSESVVPSMYYSVGVDGGDARVIPTVEHHVCTFGADGRVLVDVTPLRENIETVKVLPLSKNYKYKVEDDRLKLILSPGDRAVVEFNGKEDHDLFIFVNPIDDNKPSESDPNVRYFKAGTVAELGRLQLEAGQTLYIEGGAILKAILTAGNSSSMTEDITIAGGGYHRCKRN